MRSSRGRGRAHAFPLAFLARLRSRSPLLASLKYVLTVALKYVLSYLPRVYVRSGVYTPLPEDADMGDIVYDLSLGRG